MICHGILIVWNSVLAASIELDKQKYVTFGILLQKELSKVLFFSGSFRKLRKRRQRWVILSSMF